LGGSPKIEVRVIRERRKRFRNGGEKRGLRLGP